MQYVLTSDGPIGLLTWLLLRDRSVFFYLNTRSTAIADGYAAGDELYLDRSLDLTVRCGDVEDALGLGYGFWQYPDNVHVDPWRSPRIGDVIEVDGRFFSVDLEGYAEIGAPGYWLVDPPEDAYQHPDGSWYSTDGSGVPLSASEARMYVGREERHMLDERGDPLSDHDLPNHGVSVGPCSGCGADDVRTAEIGPSEYVAQGHCERCEPRHHAAEAIRQSGVRELADGEAILDLRIEWRPALPTGDRQAGTDASELECLFDRGVGWGDPAAAAGRLSEFRATRLWSNPDLPVGISLEADRLFAEYEALIHELATYEAAKRPAGAGGREFELFKALLELEKRACEAIGVYPTA